MRTKAMTIEGKPVLATGANRGLGQALVEEALRRGAKRVYAGTCEPLVHPDECVAPLTLDVTDPAQVHQAAEEIGSLDVLFNNAGVTLPAELAIVPVLERHLASQSLRHVGRDRGVPTAAHADRRRRHQRRLRRRPCRRAGRFRLLDLEGGRVLALAVAASPLRGPGRERACGHGRPDRHRHGPRS
jgi:NAD(P)-dependent dehydrogenase (short-subunit alcohol dehydrogenase family)